MRGEKPRVPKCTAGSYGRLSREAKPTVIAPAECGLYPLATSIKGRVTGLGFI